MGDTVAGVVVHVSKAVDDDSIRIDVVESGEPSPVSPMDEAFELLVQLSQDTNRKLRDVAAVLLEEMRPAAGDGSPGTSATA